MNTPICSVPRWRARFLASVRRTCCNSALTAFRTVARQGQRSGAFELAYKAIAPNRDHRALARMGHRFTRGRHCLRRKLFPSSRQRISTAVTATSGTSATRQRTRRSRQRTERSHVAMDRFTGKAPDKAEEVEIGFEARHISVNGARLGLIDLLSSLNDIAARPRRPHRPRRKPPGGHEIARRIRNSRRRCLSPRIANSNVSPSTAKPLPATNARGSVRRDCLQRSLVLYAAPGARRFLQRLAAARSLAASASSSGRAR